VGETLGCHGDSVGSSVVDGGSGNNMVESSIVDRGSNNTMVDCSVVDRGSNNTMVDSSIVDGGSNNTMVESRVVDRGGGNSIVDSSIVGDHWGSNRVDNRGVHSMVISDRGVHSMVISDREGVYSSVVGEGVNKSISVSIGLSISFSLDNMLDRSVLSNILWSKDTIGDSSVMSRAVVVGHGVAGNLVLGIGHRADSSSVVGHSRGGKSLVGYCGSNSIVGDGRCNCLDKRGGNSMAVCGRESIDSRVVSEGKGVHSRVVGESGDIAESPEEGGVDAAVDQSRLGFRLGTGGGDQSENYEHLHNCYC